jgi:MFS family permease
LLLTGVSIAMYSGTFQAMLQLSMDDSLNVNEKFSKGMLTASLMGVGSMVGTLMIGKIIDKKGYKVATIVNVMSLIVAYIMLAGFLVDR